MDKLIKNYKQVNEFEGGWPNLGDAFEMQGRLAQLGLRPGRDFVILGQLGKPEDCGGWEPRDTGPNTPNDNDAKYNNFCISSADGEWILSPGEWGDIKDQEDPQPPKAPKGWGWDFVA